MDRESKLYLIALPNDICDTVKFLPPDMLGSYVSVAYGSNKDYKTRQEAYDYLHTVALQRHNLTFGVCTVIIDEDGHILRRIKLMIVETE